MNKVVNVLFAGLILFFSGLLVSPLYAQEETEKVPPEPTDWARLEPTSGFFGSLKVGTVWTDLTALNQELVNNTYQPFREGIIHMGLGVDRWNRGWLVGGELYNFMSARTFANTQPALLAFHYATIHLGRRLWHQGSRQMIYVTVGGGGGLAILRARPLSSQITERFATQGVLGEVAIHGTRHFSLIGEESEYPAMLGVSIGYMRSVEPGWYIQGFDSTDIGLPVSPQGFFVRLSLGMGRWKGRMRTD